jgi:hypothetical protein
MKYMLLSLYSIFLLPSSACTVGSKFCINCKFYKKNFFTFSEFGKCANFIYYDDNYNYLVNGKPNYNLDHLHYCSTARKCDNMCGKEGKFYKEKK